jgi:uncharacterized iron-regulated membrane protein
MDSFIPLPSNQIYTLFGILFLAFVMLFIVTSFITVALIYFQVRLSNARNQPSATQPPPPKPNRLSTQPPPPTNQPQPQQPPTE